LSSGAPAPGGAGGAGGREAAAARRSGEPRGLDVLFLTQTYPRFAGDIAGPFIEELAHALVRSGNRVTVLAPHAAGLPARRWSRGVGGSGPSAGGEGGGGAEGTAGTEGIESAGGSQTAGGAGGVEVITFRYAPEAAEVLGYGRTLEADVRVRAGAAAVAPLYALAARAALARQLRRRHYDLVHAHWIVPNGVAAAAAVPAAGVAAERSGGGSGAGVALAIGLHGSDVFLAERRGARVLARWALGRARLLTGCSPELVERVCALGFPPERARVIPYGVDARVFAPDAARRRLWRERLGIPEGAPVALAVGRMAAKKGFGVLAAVLPALLAETPALHVVLAGGGDLLGELAAATAPWRGRVHLPGPVLRDTLPDLYRAADLFVLPAVHDEKGNVDGLPNVILEAMASGLPVVASGISGIPLAVEDGVSGLLVPERDAAALAAALRRLLAGGDERRRMGERGRRRAESELTWDAIAARHLEAYRAALGPISAP
jgi:glycosyltransferase involved in cell wall biosynthesis